MELAERQRVNLTLGTQATVVKELGRGGQGIVYLVDLGGKKMALKWYISPGDDADAFYRNLENNVKAGAPSKSAAFLWPEYLTLRENGSFGYIMGLRPPEYREFTEFLRAKAQFKSLRAMLNAGMHICHAFKMLHLNGYSYQDLNDGNFFINPANGDVLICDNDNVATHGVYSGIKGKSRYMAPEVVMGTAKPDKFTDRFSLSVILFLLFYVDHPFEGKRLTDCPCLTEGHEKKFYGSDIVFIMDPTDASNRPVPHLHRNVSRRWPVMPRVLSEAFIKEFGKDRLRDKSLRQIEDDWERVIEQMRDGLVKCPHCGNDVLVDFAQSAQCKCPDCGRTIAPERFIAIGKRRIPLLPGNSVYVDRDCIPDGEVITDPRLGVSVRNISPNPWQAITTKGVARAVAPQGIFPAKAGIKVTLDVKRGIKGEIV